MREHYGTFAKRDATLRIRYDGSEITLSIPVDGLVTREGWRITPFSHPTVSGACMNQHSTIKLSKNTIFQISRKDADEFEPGRWIPECQLIVQWEREDQRPVRLRHKVDLIGAKDFIHLILDPGSSNAYMFMKDVRSRGEPFASGQWKGS